MYLLNVVTHSDIASDEASMISYDLTESKVTNSGYARVWSYGHTTPPASGIEYFADR
jgi:hypothetical protein